MRTAAFAVLLLAVAGCDAIGASGGVDLGSSVAVDSRAALVDARDRWRDSGPEAYRMRYAVTCFCAPTTVDVTVEDGRIVASETDGGALAVLDVDGLYAEALRAYDRGAARVDVRVTEGESPVPVEVFIDADVVVADEEVGYRVLSFEAR